MQLTHFGHACLLVELDGARILFDPGTLSTGFESLRELDAILITHDHDDHLDAPRVIELAGNNPGAIVASDSLSADQLPSSRVVRPGEKFTIGPVGVEVEVEVVGGDHEFVYLTIPDTPNVGYLLGDGAFLHPGDSFFVPDRPIDVLALPTSGPWLRVRDAVEYVIAVAPRVAVPMHEGALANTDGQYGLIGAFTPEATDFHPLDRGVPTTL